MSDAPGAALVPVVRAPRAASRGVPNDLPPRGPATFFAIDRGTATCAASLVGRVDRRWRLLSAAAVPAGADTDALLELLVERVRAADPALASALGLGVAAPVVPGSAAGAGDRAVPSRLEAVGAPALTIAVLAATEATRERFEADAAAAGWLTAGSSAQRDDPLLATVRATRPDVAALLAGTGDPATTDERDLLGELLALAAGVAERRPRLPVILAGAAASQASAFPLDTEVVAVPRPHGGDPASTLRGILAGRRGGQGDARHALVAVTATLAELFDLRVEVVEIGMGGALRARAEPATVPGGAARVVSAEAPGAALAAVDDDAALDRIEAWATLGIDRARLRDRLAELRLAPWTDLDGEGALLRAAALRGALERLAAATDNELGGEVPDLVVLAGGAWASIPAPAALLVLSDALRRPGVVQVAADPARLLGPLGTIADPAERAAVMGDLIGDLLVPLGTVAIPRGIRGGRAAGRLHLSAGREKVELDLGAGRLALVDLPPGQAGIADLAFRSTVDLGARGRRFAVRATGGLAGLVVDLRDLPLRLPERADERRELLARWENVLWPDRDR